MSPAAKSNITPIKTVRPQKYMNAAMQHEFNSLLIKMRTEALSSQSTEKVEYEKLPDEIDIATMQEALTLDLRRRERDTMLIKKINVALAKIETKDYGYCTDCGGEIGVERLHARPTADLCISCKEAAEQKESQFSKKRRTA